MDLSQLKDLPSPFYRVALKALIFDDKQRLLLSKNDEGQWEIPGGGWEHAESIEDCIRRELQEELGANLASIGTVSVVFSAVSERGWHVARVCYQATIADGPLTPGDDQVEARYVTKDELLELTFCSADEPIKDHIDTIWPRYRS
jgi:ADP-ribose pyrophosphatase YjhB (NUDIX family)